MLRKLKFHFFGWFFILLVNIITIHNIYSSQKSYPDNRLKPGLHRPIDENLADSLFSHSLSLLYSQPDSASKILEHMRSLGADNPESIWNIRTLNTLGIIYDVKSMFDLALQYYYQAYAAALELENMEQLGNTSNNIGLTHWNTGNFKDALEYFFRALDYYDNAGVYDTRGNIHNNIGLIHSGMGNHDIAIEHYRLAYENFEKMNDDRGLGAVLTNHGLLFHAEGKADSALIYLDKSIEKKIISGDTYGQCISLESKGRVRLEMGETDKAVELFKQSLDLSEKVGYTFGESRAYMGLANSAIKRNELEQAMVLAEKALIMAKEMQSDRLIYKVYETISEIHERSGNLRESLKYFKLATDLKNETINHNRLYQVYNLEKQYATKKSLQEIVQLNQEKEIQRLNLERKDLQIKRKNTMILLIVVVFLFIIAGGVFLYQYMRQVQKARLQSALMDLRETRSRAAIEAELQERNRIGQELHDGLGQMLTIIKLNVGVLKKKTQSIGTRNEELFASAITSVDQAFRELRNISQNLGPGILSDMSLDNALQVLAKQVNQSNQINVQMETMGLESVKDHVIEITIYRSVQELVNNAIKHANANDIHVQVISDDVQVSILVEDNGKGLNEEILENSSGLGLKSIRSRIENLGGNFFMDTMEKRGCIFQIFIPLKKQNHHEKQADTYYGG